MSKRILVIHYSQTGQLIRIIEKLCEGLNDPDISIDHLKIEPKEPFPFPWTRLAFFNTFPESVFGIPLPIKEPKIDPNVDYDLIVLGYTIWYLAPSIPINSFLVSEKGKALMNGKKVITILGGRNMWVMAHEKMKVLLKACGSTLIGNIAIVDKSPNLVSIITIIRWMFYGKKDPFLGFPQAGIREEEIRSASKFGALIKNDLLIDDVSNTNKTLLDNGAVFIEPALLVLEKRATKIFTIYGNFMLKKGGYYDKSRLGRVRFLSYLIPVGAFVLSPITTLSTFLISKFKRQELEEEIAVLKRCD